MTIQFNPSVADQQFIDHQLAHGPFDNVDEMLSDALQEYKARQEYRRQKIQEMLEEAEQSVHEGRCQPFTEELMDDIRKRVDERIARGDPAPVIPGVTVPL